MIDEINSKILLKYFKTLENKSAKKLLDDTDCIIEIIGTEKLKKIFGKEDFMFIINLLRKAEFLAYSLFFSIFTPRLELKVVKHKQIFNRITRKIAN